MYQASAIALALVPGLQIGAILCEVLAILAAALALYFDRMSEDPPDPNFRVLPILVVADIEAILAAAGIDAATVQSIRGPAVALAQSLGHSRAYLQAVERALGAREAGDELWLARQTANAREHALEMVRLLGELPANLKTLAATSTAHGAESIQIPKATLDEARTRVMIPGDATRAALLDGLQTIGLDQAEASDAARLLGGADPPEGQTANQILTDSATTAQLRVLAAGFRTWAGQAAAYPAHTDIAPRFPGGATRIGCVGAAPCAEARATAWLRYLAVSPDGRHVYGSARDSGAVVVLARDPTSGLLTQPDGPAGCVADSAALPSGCATTPGLVSPAGLGMAPDGTSLYVAANGSDAVVTFSRDPTSGSLVPVGCVADARAAVTGCLSAPGLADPNGVAVTPDGGHLYVASLQGTISVFARSANGALAPTQCLADPASVPPGCVAAPGLNGAAAVAVTPDGRQVYVVARESSAVVALSRDPASGALTWLGCWSGDSGARQDLACAPARGLAFVQEVIVSPDGRHVYASGTDAHTIAVFARLAGGKLEQFVGRGGCVHDADYAGGTGCQQVVGIALPNGLAAAPDGDTVYAAAFGFGTLSAFARDPVGGAMAPVDTCQTASTDGDPRCADAGPIRGAGDVVVSPDGRHLYLAAPRDGTITAFSLSVQSCLPPTGQ
uniref:lactonase family protein n=1 Tax=Paractinoplanes polyasparticus TaxID=2856853 RepID=UPI001C864FBC|nr:beta-propeller fold lactonase family protein [Actinoplanes polyasparticus]